MDVESVAAAIVNMVENGLVAKYVEAQKFVSIIGLGGIVLNVTEARCVSTGNIRKIVQNAMEVHCAYTE